MRLLSSSIVLAVAALLAGCYQQPVLSATRPLRCFNSDASGECPAGYQCVANQICALKSCASREDCPAGLVCSSSRGCVIPPDGGADGASIQIPSGRDGGDGGGDDAFDAPAPATLDAALVSEVGVD